MNIFILKHTWAVYSINITNKLGCGQIGSKSGEFLLLPHADLWEKPVGWARVGTIFSHPPGHPPDRLDFLPNPTPTQPIDELECGTANTACLFFFGGGR